jgi:alkanesulfonate monooxygenase SsuD/methylene tetrahydromethanopterin reductase-like flavin-dependent oxidoreductase (luciferase family)
MIEGQEGVTWPQWLALAAACEEHGIPTLFRSDHYQNLDGQHPERGSLDAWATINALAAATTTLRLGTLVSPTSFRHPSVLAKLVVTADHVSQGRIDLGIGAGWHEREHEAYGFPFLPTKTRMDVLEEQLEVLMGHWGEEPF